MHLGARTDLEETEDISGYAANYQGTANLIDAICAANCVERVLFTSSQLVCKVGYQPSSDSDYCPPNLYGESKVRMERCIKEADLGTTTWCLLRPTTIWGEQMSEHYRSFLSAVEKGLYFHPGRGRLYKSYGYVGNAVWQLQKFLEARAELIQHRTFYLADYDALSLRDWVDGFAERFGSRIVTVPTAIAWALAHLGDAANFLKIPVPFTTFRLNNILTEYTFDLEATRRVCGPLPYSLQEAQNRTASWYLDNRN